MIMKKEKVSPLPIQKLLIAHWDLAKLSTGRSLSDSALEESLREEILYFYNGSSSLNQWSAASSIEKAKEVIAFNGLCKALYHFPESLAANSVAPSSENDTTQEVYLGDSILVFVLIEPQSVALVVQASRTVTSFAIRASLARSHELFCLLRGGGVHRRLCSPFDLTNEQHAYLQIGPVYRLWKEKSTIELRIQRNSEDGMGHEQLGELIVRINSLYERLPLIPLRRDLRIHYDAYVGELNQLASMPNMLRKLTEEIPIPAPRMAGEHTRFSLPLSRQLENIRPMEHAIGKFLQNQGKHYPDMVHVCCIHDGKIVFRNGVNDSAISCQAVSLTWNYMHRIRLQMQPLPRGGQPSSRSSTPTRTNRSFSHLMLSLGQRLEDAVQVPWLTSNRDDRSFLASPPLSLLSTLDNANGLKGPSEDSLVWCLPVSIGCNKNDLSLETVDAYASMYCLGDLSFLLFWKYGYTQSANAGPTESFFRDFESALSAELQGHSSDGVAVNDSSEKMETLRKAGKWHTEGIDILFIDRKRDNLILFSDPSRQLVTEAERSGRSPRRVERTTRPRSESTDLSARGLINLDCRHLLAAHLPSEVILCLEDAMVKANHATNEDLPFETCSFLSQRWLYALIYMQDHHRFELYIIFDAIKFVTLTDVEISAREIRRHINLMVEECYSR